MNDDRFWAIIDGAMIDTSDEFFLENHYLSFWAALEKLSSRELQDFSSHFKRIKKSVDATRGSSLGVPESLLDALLDGLISRGRATFESVIDSAQTVTTVPRHDLLLRCEAFSHAPTAILKMREANLL